ncbi:plastocyanin/azurin family copper-binding protein [Halorussus pelagicus]|uniref:plastocyanin/azurin family copper-binding protein n=1 Tax=Halorussus pelagicus TaxID=2505977 RepID=UPI001FB5D224|nr:plastocyanin/azurin family copper-binding protein [Halorussus pelagicus]
MAGLNATVLAQDGGGGEEVIILGGETAGWLGWRLPGEGSENAPSNPTLNLQAGTTYTLFWENVDGVGHNFAIQDANGNSLEVLEPLGVSSDVFQQINGTAPDQNVSLQISDGNVTGVGNETGGNATDDRQGTPSLVAETEIITGEGSVQGVRFETSEEMAQYICIVHPTTMVGEVSIQGGGGANSSG